VIAMNQESDLQTSEGQDHVGSNKDV